MGEQGNTKKHLSVMDYKVEQREKELKGLLNQIENLQKENCRLLTNNAVLENEEAEWMDELVSLVTVLDDEEARQAIQDVNEWTEEVNGLVREQDVVMCELEEVLERPESEWRVRIQNVLFVWQRIFFALQDLIKRITDALTGLLLYGVFSKKPEVMHEVSNVKDRLSVAQEKTSQKQARVNDAVQRVSTQKSL